MIGRWAAPRRAETFSWVVLLGALGFALTRWVLEGVRAIAFPFELDYGEGIVWEQARLLFSPAAYGPIDRFPAIVFHYTPVYHAATVALSTLTGTDMLAAGRGLALLSTLGTALVVGALVLSAAEGGGRTKRLLAAVAATLAVLACVPVVLWSPLMRVDMTAMLFSCLGLALGLHALKHERLIYLAGLCFVLAVYTKQINIAAPLALFPVLYWLRPGLALRGLAMCVVTGALTLAALTWVTSGGFVRHVFLYNVNRLDLGRLAWIAIALYYHTLYFAVALVVLRRVPALVSRLVRLTRAEREAAVAADPRPAWILVLALYWVWTTLMTLAVAKSGAAVNYLIEWMCVTSVLVGLGLHQLAAAAPPDGRPERATLWATIVPLAFGLQLAAVHLLVPLSHERVWAPERLAENAELTARIRAADKPIISDNMVLLVRNQRPVLWEPAIFAELASVGMWDEEPLVRRIRAGEFAMFITVGTRGTTVFDSRYNPRVADAMDAAYPVKKTVLAYTLHLPKK